jgi:hypothetical protein
VNCEITNAPPYIEKRPVHFPVVVFKDSEVDTFVGEKHRIGAAVAMGDAEPETAICKLKNPG